ncbi:MAG: ribosome maturation factor RimM [Clostridia bacterium]|nr:ribosome maturation factor RimM [Clostridia bacterium]
MEYIKVGQIINTHGNKGGLKIYPLTDDVKRFFELKKVHIKISEVYSIFTLETVKINKELIILTLEEISDMNEAEKLKNHYLEIPIDEVRPLPEGSFYIFQLVGLEVYEGDKYMGKIKDVLKPGANDLFVVETPENKEIYLPALKSVITRIDFDCKRVDVKIPLGLFD